MFVRVFYLITQNLNSIDQLMWKCERRKVSVGYSLNLNPTESTDYQ